MADIRIVADDDPSPAEEAALRNALAQWNVRVTAFRDYAPVNFLLRDSEDRIRGGVLAYVWARWLHVDVVWIEDALRGQGWGKRLLESAHQAGRERGADAAFLDTFSWQARPFYERLGYRVVAEVDMPPGHQRFYMVKSL